MPESRLHAASNGPAPANSASNVRLDLLGVWVGPGTREPGTPAGSMESRDAAEAVIVIPTARETPLTPSAATAVQRTVIPAERWEVATRALNVAIAAIALLIVAPICVLVALAVKLTSRGPVFYTQTRVGLDRRWTQTRAINERRVEDLGGQPFTIYKIEDFTFAARLCSGVPAQTSNDRYGYDKRRKQLSFHHILRVIDLRIGERN